MENKANLDAPVDWLDALAESEAELAAGKTVPGDEIMREIHESIARLESQKPAPPSRKATSRR